MEKILNLEQALTIEDEAERTFAVAALLGFTDFNVIHEPTIASKSGNMRRKTKVDFELVNPEGQNLFVEITKGNKKTKRKRRQRKTATLAGVGERYLTLYGNDIEKLKEPDSETIKEKITSVLKGKFNAKLFSID